VFPSFSYRARIIKGLFVNVPRQKDYDNQNYDLNEAIANYYANCFSSPFSQTR
jgi:hypothetical protein